MLWGSLGLGMGVVEKSSLRTQWSLKGGGFGDTPGECAALMEGPHGLLLEA